MKVENADITWLESGLPYSTRYEDVYYSQDDELAESQYVFIAANQLERRWQEAASDPAFHLGEIGFGSGLNFLQVMHLWRTTRTRPERLHYIAFEKHPLTLAQMKRIHGRWPSLTDQSSELLQQYCEHSAGCHRLQFADGITLDLYFGDAKQQLGQRVTENSPAIQCWFLDGFSPAHNADLWQESLMALIAQSSDEGTTLSTYTVAGKVRRGLEQAGFTVEKIEGFGRKRHSLKATLQRTRPDTVSGAEQPPMEQPWFRLPACDYEARSVLIIGAGLAGCSSAYALARRGWKVRLVDSAATSASGASGNDALTLRCRLFNAESAEASFYLHAYLYALRQFELLRLQGDLDWRSCGVAQLHNAMNKRKPLQGDKLERLYAEQVVEQLSAELASKRAGVQLAGEALYFPDGGAIDPASLCAHYLDHPNIRCEFNTTITSLHRSDSAWRGETDEGISIEAAVAIIANSQGATQFAQSADMPLSILRGQTTEVGVNSASSKLSCIVSGGRTVYPAREDRHLISASYSASEGKSESEKILSQPADNQANIAEARKNFKEVSALSDDVLSDRVSFRSSAPDRIPIVGMVPDREQMRLTYGALAANAKAQFSRVGDYHTGLYINIAHGSNGLASCPLSAEFLASLINCENLPLSRAMVRSLSPARFLISDLKKQRS